MKKNLLTVLILALIMVNIVLTTVMMFSVMSTNKKTAKLVNNIATVLNLEWTEPGEDPSENTAISLADTAVYNITGSMTIPLAMDENGKQGYIVFDVSLSMNKKDKDYKKYSETMAERESLVKDVITSVVTSHTQAECRNNFEGLKEEILEAIQNLFGSKFIFDVGLSGVKYS